MEPNDDDDFWTRLLIEEAESNISAMRYLRRRSSRGDVWTSAQTERVLRRVTQFLHRWHQPELQFECVWFLTNLACGGQQRVHQLIDVDLIGRLLAMVQQPSLGNQLRDQIIWCLSNVAGDCVRCREYLLGRGGLQICISLLTTSKLPTTSRNLVWMISNLCCDRVSNAPQLCWNNKQTVQALCNVIVRVKSVHDEKDCVSDTVGETCRALNFLITGDTSGANAAVDMIITSGMLPKLIQFCSEASTDKPVHMRMLTASVRLINGVMMMSDEYAKVVLDNDVLPMMRDLLCRSDEVLALRICRLLANLTEASDVFIGRLTECPGLTATVHLIADGHTSMDVRQSAALVLVNILNFGDNLQSRAAVGSFLPTLCRVFSTAEDPSLISQLVLALEKAIRIGEGSDGVNANLTMIFNCCSRARLRQLLVKLPVSSSIAMAK